MNWLQKIALPIRTEQLPELLAQAIAYECGGEWDAGKADNWTKNLDDINTKYDPMSEQLGQEVGYSTSFWVSCKTGDGTFHQKWGVSINFTVTSGSSNTTFDSETGDWDFSIAASVQWASPKSWTPESPYALLIRSAGFKEEMRTVQEVANFVKETIWRDQRDDDNDDDEPEDEPTTDPSVGAPVSPELIGAPV